MKRPVKLLLFLRLVCAVACRAVPMALIAARSRGRRLGSRGAERSRSDAAGAFDTGVPPAGTIGRPGHGVPGVAREGGERGGEGWRAGRGRRPWPSLPVSYSRVGFAGQGPARWCPRLWTGVAAAATGVAGVVPAAAIIPARH